jgi:predicted small lipoprotein YifL
MTKARGCFVASLLAMTRVVIASAAKQSPRGIFIALLISLLLPLAACGKKGPLEPPAGEPNTYPRQYPSE